MPLDRAAGHSLLSCSVGEGTVSHIPLAASEIFGGEPSQAFLSFGNWSKRRNSMSCNSWVEQSPKVSWMSLGRGVVRSS